MEDFLTESFNKSRKLGFTMMFGLFAYMLFVEVAQWQNWPVYIFVSFDAIRTAGAVFISSTLVFFPAYLYIEKKAALAATSHLNLRKRLFNVSILGYAIGELITIFGLAIFIMSGNEKFFYLFFAVSLVYLGVNMPRETRWHFLYEEWLKKRS